MLGASTVAQAAAAVTANGPAFLIPALHAQEGMSLAAAGLVAAAPTAGGMCALIAWGLLTDRRGERLSLLLGLIGAVFFGIVAVLVSGVVAMAAALFAAGVFAASTGSASGRVVVGWFPPQRRGLAMGIRQMAQPVGVGVAAVSMAVIADSHGPSTALWVPVVACVVAAVLVAVVVADPPRPERTVDHARNPYRDSSYLARIHSFSVLMVVPQFVVWTFSLVWLVQERGWSPAAAGALVATTQLLGAIGRIAAGQLSDVVASRMRPLRWIGVAVAVVMASLALASELDWLLAVPLLVLAAVVTVAPNGVAFTGVAESAGPFWSGRALGLHNTLQYVVAAAVPPVAGLVVAHSGFTALFFLAAVFPLLAVPLVPVGAEPDPRHHQVSDPRRRPS